MLVTPFAGPNVVGDYMRLFLIVLGFIVMLEAVIAFHDEAKNYNDPDSHRLAFHTMIFIAMVVAVGTEWGRLGHIVTWRLPLNIIMAMLAAWALWFRMPWVKSRIAKRERMRRWMHPETYEVEVRVKDRGDPRLDDQ